MLLNMLSFIYTKLKAGVFLNNTIPYTYVVKLTQTIYIYHDITYRSLNHNTN